MRIRMTFDYVTTYDPRRDDEDFFKKVKLWEMNEEEVLQYFAGLLGKYFESNLNKIIDKIDSIENFKTEIIDD